MKKRIVGILLAVIMIVGILPFGAISAFADDHDLSVTKNGTSAVEGVDYLWDGDVLYIKNSGLTVSGETASEFISVDPSIGNLTISNLNITDCAASPITFWGNSELIIKGDNTLSGTCGIFCWHELYISGDGNLDVFGTADGIYSLESLYLYASGVINAIGEFGIRAETGVVFGENVHKVLIYGKDDDSGAISWDSESLFGFQIPTGLKIKGSAEYNVAESDINGAVSYDAESGRVSVGGAAAKSVIIYDHDIKITKNGAPAEKGVDYDWSNSDANNLIIKSSGLTVSGKTSIEYITVKDGVANLTVSDLNINTSVGYPIYTEGDTDLALKGNNTLNTDGEYLSGIYLSGDTVISGDGNLDVNGNYDGIFSDGELTLSASGIVSVNGENCGIYSYGSINFTYDSNVVVAYGENEAFGGIAWDAGSGAKLIVPKEFSVCGTESYGIDEETVSLNNAYVNDVDGCIMDDENVARSVRIQGHDLYITKNGEAAVNNSDYRWEGRTLYIRVNGLAVSGTTDRDVIVAEDSVDNVTFCDLSANYSHEMYVGSDINIILSGSNVLNFTRGCDGLSFGGDSQISGKGNLIVSGAERSICGKRNVFIRSTGSIVLNGGKEGIHADGYVFFSETVGKVLAYGSEAAITWGADSGNGMSVPDKLNIQGSADINAEESEITDRVTYLTEDKCVKVGEDSAKAVLITRAADGIHDLFVKNDYREAILGTDYVWYDNELFIQKSGLTVYGSTEKEHILVASGVDNLTIKNLYITVNENDSSAIHFGGDCELILEGNNCLSNLAMTNGCCIDFVRGGVISGDGDLIITANDTGINSIDNLTVKATGELNISGAKHGISVSVGGVEFTNDVTDILIYGEANDFGAIGWATNIGFGTHLSVKGSRELYVDAEDITGNVTINADAKKLETATFTAKSIKILQHGLTVTKDGLEPEFGVDCIWENDKLIMKKSGLTVSGETDKEYIYVENTAEDLTFDNVNISAPCDAVTFTGSSELILKGTNVINCSGSNIYSHYRGIIFNKNGIISGEGGLIVNAKEEAIYCMQLLTVSASGNIVFDGYIGISAEDGVIFEDTVTNAVIYGNNDFYGAMYWSIDRGGTLYAPTGFYVCAAVDYKADEKNITHVATYASYDRCVKDGTSIARSVVVSRHGLTVTKNGVPAVQGKDYFWKASDPTVLIIKTNGLTVSGTTTRESISVNDGVNGITIENLNISVLGKVSVDFNGTGKLTLKGDNVLSSFENSDCIFFYRDGEITGDGNLTVYGASYGIFANSVLTISASGNIIAKGDALSAVNGVKGIVITDDVTKILAYSLTYGKPAVEWEYSFGGSLSVAESVNVYGGDVWCAEEYEITKPVEHGAECEAVKLGTSPAISVKFCKGGPYYGHYIHVTAASGEAVAGTDYEWDKDDTNKLIIKNSGLTVSGVSENEYIVVEESVENLTLNNLDITVSDTAAIEIASNAADFELTLDGKNYIKVNANEYDGIVFNGTADVVFRGYGELCVASTRNAIYAAGKVSFAQSCDITAEGSLCGIYAAKGLQLTYNNKVYAYGESDEYGAVSWGENGLTCDFDMGVYGSVDFKADESGLVSIDYFDDLGCYKVDGKIAKSVKITAATSDQGHSLRVLRGNIKVASGYEWDETDSNKLIITESGLSVYGSTNCEYIEVAEEVTELTLKNAFFTLSEKTAITFSGDTKLIFEGNNNINVPSKNKDALSFKKSGELAGEGQLRVTSGAIAIKAIGDFTVSASGSIYATGGSYSIFCNEVLHFCDTVYKLSLFSVDETTYGTAYATRITRDDGVIFKGSKEITSNESQITEDAEFSDYNHYIAIDDVPAMSVLVFPPHKLTVTKNGEYAEEGTDYIWDKYDKLVILQSGLTVSGTTEREYIYVDESADDLTIDNLSLSLPDIGDDAISFGGNNVELILKGNNVINIDAAYSGGINFFGNGKISGSGDLTVTSRSNHGIRSDGALTVSASGDIVAEGKFGLYVGDLIVEDTAGSVLAYSNTQSSWGAVYCRKAFTVADSIDVFGSEEYVMNESEITGTVTHDSEYGWLKVGDNYAKSVYIASKNKFVLGDFDSDGEFTSADLIYACQLDAGIITEEAGNVKALDVDGDGTFTSADLIFMCQYDAGIIIVWPVDAK